MNKILIALLAGVAAGILLAPDKGSVTSKKLSDGFNELSDKFNGLVEEFTPEQVSITDMVPVAPKMSAEV